MSSNPLHQFEVHQLIPIQINGMDISFTNASLFMVLAAITSVTFIWLLIRKQLLVPNTGQSVGEALYGFIRGIAEESIGEGYEKFMPFILTIFMMVLFGNVLGLMPYSYTFTSLLAPVGALALIGTFVSIVVGLKKNGLKWFHTFFPSGVPLFMAPFLVPIEIFSFMTKPFSLTMRLMMNMTIGHLLLKVFAGMVFSAGLLGIFPILAVGVLLLFEMFVAFLQAYIFTILTSVYIGEAMHSH